MNLETVFENYKSIERSVQPLGEKLLEDYVTKEELIKRFIHDRMDDGPHVFDQSSNELRSSRLSLGKHKFSDDSGRSFTGKVFACAYQVTEHVDEEGYAVKGAGVKITYDRLDKKDRIASSDTLVADLSYGYTDHPTIRDYEQVKDLHELIEDILSSTKD